MSKAIIYRNAKSFTVGERGLILGRNLAMIKRRGRTVFKCQILKS